MGGMGEGEKRERWRYEMPEHYVAMRCGLRLLLVVVGVGACVGVVGGGSFSPGERSVKDQMDG